MVEEVTDLGGGFVVALLPALLLAVPGIIVFVVLPAIVLFALALPLAAIGAVVALPPYGLARWLRRRRGRSGSPPGVRSSGSRPPASEAGRTAPATAPAASRAAAAA